MKKYNVIRTGIYEKYIVIGSETDEKKSQCK